jgi:hypothetical protein
MKGYHGGRSDMKRTEATLMKIKAYKNKWDYTHQI